MGTRISDHEVIIKINKLGLKSKPHFKCSNPLVSYQDSNRLIEVQNIITGEKVTRKMRDIRAGRNPWTNILNNDDVIKLVNNLGSKASPQFKCTNPKAPQRNGNGRDIELQNIETGFKVIRKFNDIKRGKNPWGFKSKRFDSNQVIRDLNKIGLKSNPRFKCINADMGFSTKGKHRLVQIINLETKATIISTMGNLKHGKNPWNKSQDRVELQQIHPMYKKLFTKHKVEYKYNFRLGSRFIDFAFQTNKGWIGLEVKQSGHWYSKNKQLSTYKQLASLKQYGLRGIILSDPKGSHKDKGSISIKELEARLSKGL